MRPDYYEMLGCERGCTPRQLKSAYHGLISKFHPDRNPDPAAAEITAKLNEAYSVLGDERKRALYDAWLDSLRQNESTSESKPSAVEVPDVKCVRCGKQDETLRLTLMHYVFSLLIITYRKGASGIWCEKCRIFQSAKWTFVSGLLGWWGIPWGPIYTLHALIMNGKGGSQPAAQNAAILRVLGYQLYQHGRHVEAFKALEKSLKLEPNVEASQLFEYLRAQQTTSKEKRRTIAPAVLTAAPSFIVALIVGYALYVATTAPSGYETRYQPPNNLSQRPVAKQSSSRQKTNDLISQLADIVEARSPVVGTDYEGTALIRDHELDRLKFDEKQLYQISESIGIELHSGNSDDDGFLASAYFNAELFALSIDIAKRLEQGQPIGNQLNGVLQLGSDSAISRWLQKSRFELQYSGLCRQLRSYSARYRPGATNNELMEDYERSKSQMNSLEVRLSNFKSSGDIDSYNSLVPTYNSEVRHLNAVASQGKLRSVTERKLDLAFNKCLDTGILMSKFQKVDIVSHATEINSLPEPDAVP
jgi:hypothetical protein